MTFNHILRKCTGGYNPSKLQKKTNNLMYMYNIKLFAKDEKELETGSENIQPEYRDGIWQRKMRHADNEKRGNDTWRKEWNYQIKKK